MKTTKTQRRKLLEEQRGCCALCRKTITSTEQICYDPDKGKLLCRRCMLLATMMRSAERRGLQIMDAVEYESRGTPA